LRVAVRKMAATACVRPGLSAGGLALWKEMKKQVKALREGISEEAGV
jgi:hypothetical protein